MCSIILIRHATTAAVSQHIMGRAAGNSLDENGRRHSEVLAESLAKRNIAAIYSSPMDRAQETARPLASRLGLTVQILMGLQEIDFGEWTGQKFSELDHHPRWQLFNSQRSRTRIPGGEHMLDVQRRMILAIEEIAQKHAGDTVAAFSHGDPIRSALCFYLGIPLDFIHRLEISPASSSLIRLTHTSVLIEYSNQRISI